MAGVIPDKKVEQVQFCETHAPIWALAPLTMGLTASQCTAFTSLTTSARKAYNDAQAAKQAYRAAVTAQNTAINAAIANAADLVRCIKAYAEQQANPGTVYAAAQIPPPAVPTPAQAPGKPTNIAVTLEPDGAITLTWDADNSAAGTGGFFNISRKLPGQTSFVNLGGAPGSTNESRRMNFTDSSIPTSAAGQGAQYIIQGRRGTLTGTPCDAVIVQFGVDGSGLANVRASVAVKEAA